MKRLLIIVCLFFFASGGISTGDEGCTFRVVFNNNTDHKVEYLLYWFDHPFSDQGSVNLAGGELEAGENHIVGHDYECGIYYVKWFADDYNHVYAFSHHENDDKIRVLTP